MYLGIDIINCADTVTMIINDSPMLYRYMPIFAIVLVLIKLINHGLPYSASICLVK